MRFREKMAIMNFSKDHINDTTSLPIQWAALKYVVCGLFIKHGARLKKVKGNKSDPAFEGDTKIGNST